jgi:hypothetical protein
MRLFCRALLLAPTAPAAQCHAARVRNDTPHPQERRVLALFLSDLARPNNRPARPWPPIRGVNQQNHFSTTASVTATWFETDNGTAGYRGTMAAEQSESLDETVEALGIPGLLEDPRKADAELAAGSTVSGGEIRRRYGLRQLPRHYF